MPKSTTMLLLDDFLNGLINKLFRQKWAQFGWKLHYAKMSLELSILSLSLIFSMKLKQDPYEWKDTVIIPGVISSLITLSSIDIFFTAYLYYKNEFSTDGVTVVGALRSTIRFLLNNGSHIEFLSQLLILIPCGIIMSGFIQFEETVSADQVNCTNLTASSGGCAVVPIRARMLKGSSAKADDDEPPIAILEGSLYGSMGSGGADALNVCWPLLACGVLARSYLINKALYIPIESLNVFLISVSKILVDDVAKFLIVFLTFIISFFFAMYIVYPRANGFLDVPFVDEFNTWYEAVWSLFQLGFLGAEIYFDLEAVSRVIDSPAISTRQMINLVIFSIFYLFFVLMTIILLLNLLIAMLSNTFMTVCKEATLECRLSFARLVLRLESYGAMLGMNCKVGKLASDGTDRYIYEFRAVEGGDNLFEDSLEVTCTELAKTVDANQKTVEEKLEAIMSRLADISSGKAAQLPQRNPQIPRLGFGWGRCCSRLAADGLTGKSKIGESKGQASTAATAPFANILYSLNGGANGAAAAHGAAAAQHDAQHFGDEPAEQQQQHVATEEAATEEEAPKRTYTAVKASTCSRMRMATRRHHKQQHNGEQQQVAIGEAAPKSTAVEESACPPLHIASRRRRKMSTPSGEVEIEGIGSPSSCSSQVREEPVEEAVAQEEALVQYATVRSSSMLRSPSGTSSMPVSPRSEVSEWL